MLNKILVATVLTMTGFVAAAATATTGMPAAEQHAGMIYVTGNLGYGKVSEQITEGSGLNKPTGGFSTDFSVGYHANSVWGAEVGYQSYPNEKFSPNVEGKKNHAFFLAVKGEMELRDHFKVYGRAGPALVHHTVAASSGNATTSVDRSKLTLLLGAGLSYALTDNIDINVLDIHGTIKRDTVPAMYFVGAGITWTPSFW